MGDQDMAVFIQEQRDTQEFINYLQTECNPPRMCKYCGQLTGFPCTCVCPYCILPPTECPCYLKQVPKAIPFASQCSLCGDVFPFYAQCYHCTCMDCKEWKSLCLCAGKVPSSQGPVTKITAIAALRTVCIQCKDPIRGAEYDKWMCVVCFGAHCAKLKESVH